MKLFCRLCWYLALSYLWAGLMILLFTRQATLFLWMGTVFSLLFALLCGVSQPGFFRGGRRWAVHFLMTLLLIGVQVAAWRFAYFERDPQRVIPEDPAILAPADGFVVYIRNVEEGRVPLAVKNEHSIRLEEILKMKVPLQESVIIGIFMTPVSVHVNRAPISGVVESRAYFKGDSLASMLPMGLRTILARKPFESGSRHIIQNERETLLIRGDFPVVLTRIADRFVDKIVTWKKEGEFVRQGERLGMIKMGSQTDVVFPARVAGRPVRVLVREGQYVYAGSTVLARFE
ncbi:MAG: phosphatidylserine decarboxylase [Candidatus Omnitrophica bacterium]|nr:phosphatidylserine decarboxylase [Candidatus Omnitrophota bacterium]